MYLSPQYSEQIKLNKRVGKKVSVTLVMGFSVKK